MTPTLFGRWQTRFFLLLVFGSIINGLFIIFDEYSTWQGLYSTLFYVLIFGIFWDHLYQVWTRRRWDRDWPHSLQFITGIAEGVFLYGLIWLLHTYTPLGIDHLPGLSLDDPEAFQRLFIKHYTTVFMLTYLATKGLMQIFFPKWRYQGGQFFILES